MERDPAKLIPRQRLALLPAVGLSLLLAAALSGCGGDDDGGAAPGSTTTEAVEAEEFCVQLAAIVEDDPFEGIFGNDNPMEAAAVFDGGQRRLEMLVDAAPDDVEPAATQYRDAFAGFRELVLPSTTIDETGYDAAFDELRAEQVEAHELLVAHLSARCASR